jgi:hypothetical protein
MSMGDSAKRIKDALADLRIRRSAIRVETVRNTWREFDERAGCVRQFSEPRYAIAALRDPRDEETVSDHADELASSGLNVLVITYTCGCISQATINTNTGGGAGEVHRKTVPEPATHTKRCPNGPYGATTAAISDVLVNSTLHGVSDGPADEIAQEWARRGFTATDVSQWLDAGCVSATVAWALQEAGVSASRAADVVTANGHTGRIGELAAHYLIFSADFHEYAAAETSDPDPTLNTTPKTGAPTMRNVITTVATLDVPEDYSEAVREILADASKTSTRRETYQRNEHGQEEYATRLVSYSAPDTGDTVWAVEDADPATYEVEETADQGEADARYEELVRARAAAAGYDAEGNEEIFDYTDVPGVAAKRTSSV